MTTNQKKWTPSSWRDFKQKHIPTYKDQASLREVGETLSQFPPLVFAGEVQALKQKLKSVANRESFLLQGGDCAESFSYFNADNLRDSFKVLLQMAIVLTAGANKPVVKLGRIAGQFAKPRSSEEETKDGVTLPSYFGDIINGNDFTEESRTTDPGRMLKAYSQSASTLNLLRAFASGGFADLKRVHAWNMDFVKQSPEGQKFEALGRKIDESLKFMAALGVNSDTTRQLKRIDFYTSHELLLLPYEEALTRLDSSFNRMFNTSAHFLWIGDRTRFLDSAHIEFARGIENPIGIKCGPSTDMDELVKMLDIINPENEEGKVVLITRFGQDKIAEHLPQLIKGIEKSGKSVIWSCDPMHGNVIKSSSGHKTRPFNYILSEIKQFFQIHQAEGSYPGGVHLELTGKNVTECTGGVADISDDNLKEQYETLCDPRLNSSQSIELAFLIADFLK